MPKISVIVPVYKVEQYLRRCVDSILAQTFTDFELILVDDGSTDNCPAICDEYAEKDRRVHVIHQANGGLSAARNAGIDWAFANSDSEYFSFIDSDDRIHPQMLEILYNGLISRNVRLSICAYKETNNEEAPCQVNSFDFCVCNGMDFLTDSKSYINAVVAWGKLYQRDLFDDVRYPVGRIHEDEFTTYKVLYKAGDIAFCENKLYYYSINNNGITKSEYSLKRMDAVAAWEEREKWFKRNKLNKYIPWSVKQLYDGYLLHYRLTAQNKDYEKAHRMLQKKLRRALIFKKKYANIKGNVRYYEVAFPKLMWIYRACIKRFF